MKKIDVFCEKCRTRHCIDHIQISIIPIGYKGNFKCIYTCSVCQNEILLPNHVASQTEITKIIFDS